MTDADGPAAFGADLDEPYARALEDEARALLLHELRAGVDVVSAPSHLVDMARYLRAADPVDRRALEGLPGPLLDVGCGPGRITEAAAGPGRRALGIDVSPTAVRLAHRRGVRVLRRSVFDALPCEGRWGSVVLFDGNIGIGGDPAALLRRCAALVRPGEGRVVVETHAEAARDRLFEGVVTDDLGHRSGRFPWAETGALALRPHAVDAGLMLRREWTAAGRSFADYRRP